MKYTLISLFLLSFQLSFFNKVTLYLQFLVTILFLMFSLLIDLTIHIKTLELHLSDDFSVLAIIEKFLAYTHHEIESGILFARLCFGPFYINSVLNPPFLSSNFSSQPIDFLLRSFVLLHFY